MAESADFTRSKYLEGLKRLARTLNAKAQQSTTPWIANLHTNEPDRMIVETVYSFVPAQSAAILASAIPGAFFPATLDTYGNPISSPGTIDQASAIDVNKNTKMVTMPPLPYNTCVIETWGLPPPDDPLANDDGTGVATGTVPIYTPGVRYSTSYASPLGGEVPLPGDRVYVQRKGRDLMIISAVNSATNHFQQTWSFPGLIPASYAAGGRHPVEAEHATRIGYVCATLGTVDTTSPTALPVTVGCWLTHDTDTIEFTQITIPCQIFWQGGTSYKRGDCVTLVVGSTAYTLLCVKPGVSGASSNPPGGGVVGQLIWDPVPTGEEPYAGVPLVCWQVVPRHFTSQSFYDDSTTPPCGQFTNHTSSYSVATSFADSLQVSIDSYTGSTAADLVVRMKGQ